MHSLQNRKGRSQQLGPNAYLSAGSHLFVQGLQLGQDGLNGRSLLVSVSIACLVVRHTGVVMPLSDGQSLQSLAHGLYLLAE